MNFSIISRIVLFLCCEILHTTAQQSDCSRTSFSLDGRFFDALRKMVSDGDVCKARIRSGNDYELGPYQISEEFYNDTVEFDPTLSTEGLI